MRSCTAPNTRAILHCAEHPQRDVFVGLQKKDNPPRPREENSLDGPAGNLEERGPYDGHVAKSSLYTQAVLHPGVAGAALVGVGLLAAELLRGPDSMPGSDDGEDGWPGTRSDLRRSRGCRRREPAGSR